MSKDLIKSLSEISQAVEPDRVDEETSHLGKSVSRPYVIDPANPETPLLPYDFAEEKMGEDPALTRISRRMADGALINMWLLSCVNVQTYSFKVQCLGCLYDMILE